MEKEQDRAVSWQGINMGIVHTKINSLLRHFEPEWIAFFFRIEKKMFWRIFNGRFYYYTEIKYF